MQKHVFEYKFLNVSISMPDHPDFINLNNNICLFAKSKASSRKIFIIIWSDVNGSSCYIRIIQECVCQSNGLMCWSSCYIGNIQEPVFIVSLWNQHSYKWHAFK